MSMEIKQVEMQHGAQRSRMYLFCRYFACVFGKNQILPIWAPWLRTPLQRAVHQVWVLPSISVGRALKSKPTLAGHQLPIPLTLILLPDRFNHSSCVSSLRPSMLWILLFGKFRTCSVCSLATPFIRTRRLLAMDSCKTKLDEIYWNYETYHTGWMTWCYQYRRENDGNHL